jgi:hypothetical protein
MVRMGGLRPLRSERSVYVCMPITWNLETFLSAFGRMPPFPPGLDWHTPSSETERHEKKKHRTLSEPTLMDVDGEEGSQFRCSFCNGNRLSPNFKVSTLPLTNLTQKIEFPSRIQIHLLYISTTVTNHFLSAPVFTFLCLPEVLSYLCLVFRFTNFSLHSIKYDEKIYATSEHRA